MRKTWVLCSLYFVMGAAIGAGGALHYATAAAQHWLTDDQQTNANWAHTVAQWQTMAEQCQARFNVATVLYEPRPAPAFSVPVAGGALDLSIALAGATSGDQAPAWYIPAQVTPRSAAGGMVYQWIDAATGRPLSTIQLAPAALAAK